MTEFQAPPAPPVLSLTDALEEMRLDHTLYPRVALDVLLTLGTAAIPGLINILEEIIKDPETHAKRENLFTPIYVLELLSQLKAEEAHTTIAAFLTLPKDLLNDILGDYLYKFLPETLFNTLPGNWNELKRLIELDTNPEVSSFVSAAAVNALYLSTLSGKADRDEVLDYFAEMLKHGVTVDSLTYDHIFSSMGNLHPGKYVDLLYEIIARQPDPPLTKEDLDKVCAQGPELSLELARSHVADTRYPDDLHERLLLDDDDDCCSCGHEHHHHHGHHHHHTSSASTPQKHVLPKNQRAKNKKKVRSTQRQARKKNRRK
jgi:hypothetical protein